MSRRLALAPGLSLPVEFATEGVAVIGMRGSGKSNTEVRFAELLSEAKVPFCAVDPKGDWHGVRSSADGKRPGLQVPVFGGLHGDFPLEASMGARIADLLVDQMLSAVLDVSAMSKTGGLPQFLTAFCNQLMHRHQLEPHVRTVILEEAHRYIPQSVSASQAKLKEAASALLLEGRAFGLGCWAATQRPARLHKDVLEEVGTAIIHRIGVSATNDKRTIRGWVDHYELSGSIVDSLTSLRAGQAWVLIPDLGIVKCVQIDRRQTFDSAATPKVGATLRAPTNMADIDGDAIREALAEAVERAKANDPAELRSQLAKLRKEMAALQAQAPPEPQIQVEEREVLVPTAPEGLAEALAAAEEAIGAARRSVAAAVSAAGAVREKARLPAPPRVPASPRATAPPPERALARASEDGARLKAGARRMLGELAAFPNGLTATQLSLRAKVKRSGGSWSTYLSALRVGGLIDEGGVGFVATQAGLDWLGVSAPSATTPAELRDRWLGGSLLKAGARRMLSLLIEAFPNDVSREELSERSGVALSGGSWSTYLSTLRSNELVLESTSRHRYRASEELIG